MCIRDSLNVMRRYQYLTQAMVELEDGRPDTVQLTLAPLEPYVQNCARIIDGIHLNVLTAIDVYKRQALPITAANFSISAGSASANTARRSPASHRMWRNVCYPTRRGLFSQTLNFF